MINGAFKSYNQLVRRLEVWMKERGCCCLYIANTWLWLVHIMSLFYYLSPTVEFINASEIYTSNTTDEFHLTFYQIWRSVRQRVMNLCAYCGREAVSAHSCECFSSFSKQDPLGPNLSHRERHWSLEGPVGYTLAPFLHGLATVTAERSQLRQG